MFITLFFSLVIFQKVWGRGRGHFSPSSLKRSTVETTPQRPSRGHKKVAVVERWPLWGGGGVIMTDFCWGSKTCLSCQIHAYCIKCGGGAEAPPAPPPVQALKRGTVETYPQWPSWGHKKVAVVGR